MSDNTNSRRKPEWLKIKMAGGGEEFSKVKRIVADNGLHTICTSGKCPNMAECWGAGTATFMILGDICTRACRFCGVATGRPLPPDENEPAKIANSVKVLKLKHCVLTSVDRDDLPDLGASHWTATIRMVKEINSCTTIEGLIPDFDGQHELVKMVSMAGAEVISHNLETTRRLTPLVRSKAGYGRSLDVVRRIAETGVTAKSGIMLGLGESTAEVLETMDDLLAAGCKVMTIGQYLQPGKTNIRVERYVHPDEFEFYREEGIKRGFRHVESSPLVRSSYHAEKHVK